MAHGGGTATDGTDTMPNVERLQFADQTVNIVAPGAPTIGAVTAGNARATVNFTPPAAGNGPAITGFSTGWLTSPHQLSGGDPRLVGADANVVVVTGLTNGSAFRFQIAASNAVGTGAFSALSSPVSPVGDTTPPTVTARTPAVNATGVAVAADITATFSENVVGTGTTTVTVRDGANPAIAGVVTYNAATRIATLNPDAALANNTLYTVALTAGITDVAETRSRQRPGRSGQSRQLRSTRRRPSPREPLRSTRSTSTAGTTSRCCSASRSPVSTAPR